MAHGLAVAHMWFTLYWELVLVMQPFGRYRRFFDSPDACENVYLWHKWILF
jgi:hypothetical protein